MCTAPIPKSTQQQDGTRGSQGVTLEPVGGGIRSFIFLSRQVFSRTSAFSQLFHLSASLRSSANVEGCMQMIN